MIFSWLLLLVPISLILRYFLGSESPWVFICAILAIIPLAEWIRRGTEQLSHRAGPAIGGLLNVTFGNTAEFVLALTVLTAGHQNVVKGQITGSIIGNGLLGLGLAILVGTWGRDKLTFSRVRVGQLSSLLFLVMTALLVPALFDYTERGIFASHNPTPLDERLSLGVSVILILVYVANLIYTLVTHRDVFAFACSEDSERTASWPLWKSLAILCVATVITAWEAELVSGALEATAEQLGLSMFFLGVIVFAIIGNIAEYVSAMYFARKNKMDLAMSISLGSTVQVALLLAPLLVIVSWFIGTPMNLVFSNPLELIAIMAVTFGVNSIASDGETTWFEGVLLLALYLILGIAFFLVGK